MIKYIKTVTFYKNGRFLESADLEKRSFYTEEEAYNYLLTNPLYYYYNKKYYTCIESAKIYIKTATGYKIKNKSINPVDGSIKIDKKNF